MTDLTTFPTLTPEDQKFLAEARLADKKAEREEIYLVEARINLEYKKEAQAIQAASDDKLHIYQFDGYVNYETVFDAIHTLNRWSRTDPGCDIDIVINSGGGSVVDGFALWDELKTLQGKGHKITTRVRGMAASMALVLLQAGDVRQVGAESVVLAHEISFGAGGKIGVIEDQMEFGKMLNDRVLDILSSRSTLTKAALAKKWKRKDWWMGAEEAIEVGFADEIG